MKKIIYSAITLIFITYNFIFHFYLIPSESMYPQLIKSDYFIALKGYYGLKIPKYKIININMFPNFQGNNFFIIWKLPDYKDVLLFKENNTNRTFIKRVIAKEGDEILLTPDNKIYINFINKKTNTKKDFIFFENKKYVDTTFNLKEIHYDINDEESLFDLLKNKYLKKDFQNHLKEHLKYHIKENYFSYKLKQGEYYMLGDNRNNSLDSRYYGPIRMSQVEGKAYKVIKNLKESNRKSFLIK